MKPRYTITVTNNETGKEEIIEAANGIVLTMDKPSIQEFTEAFHENRTGKPMVALRLYNPSELDVLLFENAFEQRMQRMKETNPNLDLSIQEAVAHVVKAAQEGVILDRNLNKPSTDSKSLVDRLLDRG